MVAGVFLVSQEILLDQLGAIVDGRPVKQSHVLFVRLSDVIACFHQLLAAFQDSKPDRSHTENTDCLAAGSLGELGGAVLQLFKILFLCLFASAVTDSQKTIY